MMFGGGRTGELESCSTEKNFLECLDLCCSAAFSNFVEPSSARIALMRRSRSATLTSRMVVYSVRKYNKVELLERVKRIT